MYKDLLNFNKKIENKKNIIEVWVKWESNDADYIDKRMEYSPEALFNNKKLIYCLAYAVLPANFKGHDCHDYKFCQNIPENTDIEDIADILDDSGFMCYSDSGPMCYSDWGPCHSLEELEMTYYNENGEAFKVNFDKIHNKWKNMTYQEICDEINNIK